jgi:hypothetical protein
VARLARAVLAIDIVDGKRIRAIPLPSTKRNLVKLWLNLDPKHALIKALELAAERKSLTRVRAANLALEANGAAGRLLARRLGMRVCR